MKSKNLKGVIFLAILIIITRGSSFFKLMLISNQFGVSLESDAYLLAESIPLIVFASFIAAINTSFTPSFLKTRRSSGEEVANHFVSRILLIVSGLSILIFIFTYVFAAEIISFIGSGLEYEGIILTVKVTRIMILTVLFNGWLQVFVSYLQANDRPIGTIIYTLPAKLFIIILMLTTNDVDIIKISIAFVIGTFISLFIFLLKSLKVGFRFSKFKEF